MNRKASMDDVLRLALPATGPAPTESLDIAALAGLLVERREHHGELDLKLFGRLDGESARLLESTLLAELPAPDLLDLTHLDEVEPGALRRLTDHQGEQHRAGRQMLLRIAPHQVAELNQIDS